MMTRHRGPLAGAAKAPDGDRSAAMRTGSIGRTLRAVAARRRVRIGAVASIALLTAGLTAAPATAAPAADTARGYQQCADSALRTTVVDDPEGSGAGQRLSYVVFTNIGTKVCRVTGAPRVAFVGHGDGTQLGEPAESSEPAAPFVVMLRHGDAARAALQHTNIDEGGGPLDTACQAERADGYRVYPPHSTRSVFVASPQWACGAKVHWGTVSAVDTVPVGTARAGKACVNTAKVPAGAVIGRTEDVDLDGLADTQFYGARKGHLLYGIRTAAGGVYTITDPLKGQRAHSGWTVNTDSAGGTITVIDDQRTARLYDFRGCRFIATQHKSGGAYQFAIGSTAKPGTGVACNDQNGGILPMRATARKRSNGRYDIVWTLIQVSADGRTAVQDPTSTDVRWANLKASDPRVAQARSSYCFAALKVEARTD
jgi:hypothetical protein